MRLIILLCCFLFTINLATAQNTSQNIALILPLSEETNENYLQIANAIKNGFLAAYYADLNENKPKINIYDSPLKNSIDNYYQAIDDGANLIVGPLDKKSVATLSHKFFMHTPTLALNYVETNHPPSNLYQYGLSAEDEAIQTAELIWQSGKKNLIMLVEDDAWGEKIAQSFKNKFQNLGGEIVAQAYLNLENEPSSVAAVLNINQSQNRKNKLEKFLKTKLNFEVRPRRDLDGIFLATNSNLARQIPAILRFNYAGDLPIYSISSIYPDGILDQDKIDNDLDNIVFCDMPWIINPNPNLTKIKAQINNLWPNNAQKLTRFYAMGIDAYHLAISLSYFKDHPNLTFNGATGLISLNNRHQFQRHLTWAKFMHGQAQALIQMELI